MLQTDIPKRDDSATSSSARSPQPGVTDEPRPSRRSRTRAGQASTGGAIALIAIPLVGLLVVALIALGAALGRSLESSRTVVADSQLSAQEGVEVSPGIGGRPSADASAATTTSISRGPTAASEASGKPATNAPGGAAVSPPVPVGGALEPRERGTITIQTFGYDFGPPPDGARFVADVRNIDAGHFSQLETGLMPDVRARVMATADAQQWLGVLTSQWMPALKDGDLVAIGCAAGHHRSVTLAVLFAGELIERGYKVNLVHRDILRAY